MIETILLISIWISFFATLFVLPSWIRRAKNAGLVGEDVHKTERSKLAEAGGVTVIVGFALGVLVYVSINTFIFESTKNFIEIFALTSSILLISFVAFTDDILGWKIGMRRRTRIILVAFASIPLVAINAGKSSIGLPFLGNIELGIFYPLVFIPLGIVGATTTFNFLAGFNGLEAGQGIILLTSLALVSFFTGNHWLSIVALCAVASLVAFLIFNFHPAKVFPGDVLTYFVGGLIAIVAILGNFEKVAVFFFIPFIIEVFLKSRGRFTKESFGKIDRKGNLILGYDKIYSLSHLAIYLLNKTKYKASEIKVVALIWSFQIVVVLIGLAIFNEGIFR